MIGFGTSQLGDCADVVATALKLGYRHMRHRRGIGRALMADLVKRARGLQYHALVGGCCSESTAVIALLEALEFDRVAHFREVGRKFDRWLDVVFLERLLRKPLQGND